MKKEIYKDIPNYEGLYQISNLGNVKSLQNYGNQKERIMKLSIKRGYYEVGLRKNGIKKYYLVHRLVAQTFLDNSNNLPQVNHKDENKLNNYVDNLEWCTASYNNTYGTRLEKVSSTNKLKKKVIQYDINGNKLNTFNSIASASRETNTNITGISNCINNKQKTANNYIWVCESVVMSNA